MDGIGCSPFYVCLDKKKKQSQFFDIIYSTNAQIKYFCLGVNFIRTIK